MSSPFFSCPRCKCSDVMCVVQPPTKLAPNTVTIHPRCRSCGLAEHGALSEDTNERAPDLYTRWLHPSRRLLLN